MQHEDGGDEEQRHDEHWDWANLDAGRVIGVEAPHATGSGASVTIPRGGRGRGGFALLQRAGTSGRCPRADVGFDGDRLPLPTEVELAGAGIVTFTDADYKQRDSETKASLECTEHDARFDRNYGRGTGADQPARAGKMK